MGLAGFSLRIGFVYGKGCSAVLFIVQPRTIRFKEPYKLTKLPALQGKQVVTEVTTCPAYYLALSHGGELHRLRNTSRV